MEQFYKYPYAPIYFSGKHSKGKVMKSFSELVVVQPSAFSECQLILKSLEDITEEDCIKGAEILGEKPVILDKIIGIAPTGKEFFKTFTINIRANSYIGGNRYEAKRIIAAFDFLRSRNYDIDGYIEKGLAIKEK